MAFSFARTLLDRPGARGLLGQLSTMRSHMLGNHARIFYDGAWIHRFGAGVIADWNPNPKRNLPRRLEVQRDYWLSLYTPPIGGTVIDVGSGVGTEALMFARAVGPTGRVIAIEAHPRTYECLVKTCRYNSLDNVVPLNIALVDREQSVMIEDDVHHISNAVTPDGSGTVSVRGRSLGDVCAELGIERIDYLRTNIEGAEQLAIKGMGDTIGRTAFVGIACHDFKADKTGNEFYRTKKIITTFLAQHGFKFLERPSNNPWTQDYVYAFNPTLIGDPRKP